MHRYPARRLLTFVRLVLVCAPLLSLGCVTRHIEMWGNVDQCIAVLHPTEGNTARGTVRFLQLQEGVKVIAHVEGLNPNSTHAIHVHEYGDCSAADGTSAGGHYNPEGHDHGLPEQQHRHAGDLGNLKADAEGKAHYEITVHNLSVAELTAPVIGRAVIVHARKDTGAQPTGDAGPRIACGVIGVANTEK